MYFRNNQMGQRKRPKGHWKRDCFLLHPFSEQRAHKPLFVFFVSFCWRNLAEATWSIGVLSYFTKSFKNELRLIGLLIYLSLHRFPASPIKKPEVLVQQVVHTARTARKRKTRKKVETVLFEVWFKKASMTGKRRVHEVKILFLWLVRQMKCIWVEQLL